VKHDEALVGRFIEEKAIIAHRILTRWFADKGIDLDDLLADRRARLAGVQKLGA
jgi:hypothetical protein